MADPADVAPVTPRAERAALLAARGVLLVLRPPLPAVQPAPGQPGAASSYVPALPDVFIAVHADGRVQAFNGHVDLGTGIATALTQLVADELDVEPARVSMILGHTEATPNQGPTIASASIQISAMPLRRAAAQARARLLAWAADALGVAQSELSVADGQVAAASGACISYWTLLQERREHLTLDDTQPLKPPSEHRLVGRRLSRIDIPAKATGQFTYVHDVRVPGMLHGRVVRPPYAGRDAGSFVGHSLVAIDEASIADIPGVVRLVVEGDFVGIVAEREEQAIRAARRLRIQWQAPPPVPALEDIEAALRRAPSSPRELASTGDVEAALAGGRTVLARTYVWPYQMHGSIGPSCAVADYRDDRLTVWSGTQNPHMLRIDLDRLFGLGEERIEVIRMEAAGCYGRNCADDVCADAALLSRAVGRPVRVQLSREQEHVWEPKGAAQLMQVRGALDAHGNLSAYDFQTWYPSNDAPMLALLLTGTVPAEPRTLQMGDRTAVPPYRYGATRIQCHDMPPLVRAAWLRGVSALPNSFAHECFVDELAHEAGEDPLAFRLRHLDDPRAADLLRAVAERAAWRSGAPGSRGQPGPDGKLRGRGLAYARYIHSKFPGFGAAWSAWVADVEVDPASGAVAVERVVVGQDTGMVVNPDGVIHQVHGNVIQMVSRVLKERVSFDRAGVASREWGTYPILGFVDVPAIDVVLVPRQDQPPLGAGESASVPGAAAIANALFDATGRRFRQAPFTPAVVRAQCAELAAAV
ncbi:MAG: molybdopterin-dependent oxidoreductase [Pigmentiphaga sp.]|uniref:xanthine dehydrogenase family protein molybdopterin-binding subunit n=1 Tax=Pigmentiphaga sp. TaxID=1977564 RepID=UPI0029B4D794|nr:molybdopterin cofactor-binding domain-containing protein [Pigmentiphaga sp.]MDX3904883.1 molybdopterin-dependent oxidoreductase [Pigmentiphaga sp.]